MNRIKISGRTERFVLSHTKDGKNYYKTIFNVRQNLTDSDRFVLVIPEESLKEEYNNAFVIVEGLLKTFSPTIGGRTRLFLQVWAEKIAVTDDFGDDINEVSVSGNLFAQPSFRDYTKKSLATFQLIVKNGNESYCIPCSAWNKNARSIKELSANDPLGVTGRIHSRTYIKKGTTKKRKTSELSVLEITA